MRRRIDFAVAGGIFLFAFALRFGFISTRRLPPLHWDAAGYWKKAKSLAFPVASWPDFKGSIDRLAQRGPVYPLFLSLFFRLPGPPLASARVGQAAVDSLACALLLFLGRRLGEARAGAVAGLLAAVYPPLVFSSSSIMQECLTGFLAVALALALTPGVKSISPLRLFGGGALLGVLMLCRRTMLYFPPFLLAGVAAAIGRRRIFRLLSAGAAGLLLVLFVWFGLLAIVPPRYPLSAIFGYGDYPWTIDYIRSDGWFPDVPGYGYLLSPDDRLEKRGEGEYTAGERLSLLFRAARFYSLPLLGTYLKNLFRQWYYPYVAYWPPLLLSDQALFAWHRLLVLFALVGIPLSCSAGRRALVPLSFLVYGSILIPLVVIESRMVLPLMPLTLLFSALAAVRLAQGGRDLLRRSGRAGIVGPAALLALAVLLFSLRLPSLSALFPGLTAEGLRGARIALINAGWISLVRAVYLLLRQSAGRRRAAAAAVFFAVVALGAANFNIRADRNWREWTGRLSSPGREARQTFRLPTRLAPSDYCNPALVIDLRQIAGEDSAALVTADGNPLPVSFSPSPNELFHEIYATVAAWRHFPLDSLRQWIVLPLEMETLRDGELTVAVGLRPGAAGSLELAGDFVDGGRRDSFSGPALPLSAAPDYYLRSYNKLGVDWEDRRLSRRIPLGGAEVSAGFLDRGEKREDLAPDCGRRFGLYRIFLRLTALPGALKGKLRLDEPVALIGGAAEIVSAPERKKSWPDFRGESSSGTASLVRPNSSSDLAWRSEICPSGKRTILAFIGNASPAAGGLDLAADGRRVIGFRTGTGETALWREGGWELLFDYRGKAGDAPRGREGYSGVYYLSGPSEAVTPGKPLEISVRFTAGPPEAWFLVKETPLPVGEYVYF